MLAWAHKVSVMLAIAAVAVAGIVAPRLALSSGHLPIIPSNVKLYHNAAYMRTAGSARMPCHGHDASHGKRKHAHDCCGAVCGGSSALIVEQFELSYLLVESERPSPAIGIHRDAPITLIERPPKSSDT